MKKSYFGEVRNFSALDEWDCQAAWLLHIGTNLVAKHTLGQMWQIHPISTCIIGKIGQFFRIRVFFYVFFKT